MPTTNTMHRFNASLRTCRKEYSTENLFKGLKSGSERFVACSFMEDGSCSQFASFIANKVSKCPMILFKASLQHYPLLCCLCLCSVCSRNPNTQLLFVAIAVSCLLLWHATMFVVNNKQLSIPVKWEIKNKGMFQSILSQIKT